MPHMYHPDLKTAPGYNPVEIADDEGLIRQMTDTGWGIVDPPEQDDPSKAAVQPGATYVVKNPEADKPRARGKTKTGDASDS